ncbi:MAG TPA: response regulator [Candidatus Paceibacterota bacterium]|nr:response regulator [Verrucomicrobiota bacterium]HSA09114.1 response regulator [Candidatus Paceibacterota bacterium]
MESRGASKAIVYVAVVDDDESVCRSFGRLLRTAGFQPVTYASAEALLEDAKRPHFDCLVLDIQLDGMSGVELSRRLKAVKDSTPVIFITAHDEPEVRSQAQATGCAGYFRKTDPGEQVLEAIRRATSTAHGKTPGPRLCPGKTSTKKP